MNLGHIVMHILFFVFVQDYTSNHYVLSLAMKKVLVHEVRLPTHQCFFSYIFILLY